MILNAKSVHGLPEVKNRDEIRVNCLKVINNKWNSDDQIELLKSNINKSSELYTILNMRILWITNIMMPPLCECMNMASPSVGGWMYSSLKNLKENEHNKYAVATVWESKEFKEITISGITYFLLPLNNEKKNKYNSHLEKYWSLIHNSFKPNLIHIHGSEFPHGLAYVKACGSKGVVVSIQGLISCCARYYTANINNNELKRYSTFRDLIRGGILSEQKSFERRGKLEIELLKSVNHIIGRTEWDKSHSWALNPSAHYYHVGETLRDSFYQNRWTYDQCEPHTIFVSQASYPIKGIHKLLKALPLVLRNYPDTKVYVAGRNLYNRPWYRLSTYGNYIKNLIKTEKLEEVVCFTGLLNEEQMCQQYLKCNLFVCCSAIENSPNSLGEAQMLGTPHLATFAGGIPEIVNYNPDILYRFEEYEMLAKKICEVFSLEENVESPNFNRNMYDRDINLLALEAAYKQIYDSCKLADK